MPWIRNRPLGLVYRDKAKSFGGYTLYSPVRGHHADLLDAEGRIVHQWHHPEGIQHIKLLPNGHLLVHALPPETAEGLENIGGCPARCSSSTRTATSCGSTAIAYMHHDYQRLANGNTLVDPVGEDAVRGSPRGSRAATSPRTIPSGCGATSSARSIPTGATVREWRSWEHLSPTTTSSARSRAARSGRTSTRSSSRPRATGCSASG